MKRRTAWTNTVTERERSEADLFERDLFGEAPRARTARGSAEPRPRRSIFGVPTTTAIAPWQPPTRAATVGAIEPAPVANADDMSVLAGPGGQLTVPLAPGDVYMRRAFGEAKLMYVAEIASGDLMAPGELAAFGLQPEGASPGWYARVVAPGEPAHVARRILDANGRLPNDSAVFRPRPAAAPLPTEDQAEVAPPRTFTAVRFGGNADLLRILNGQRLLRNISPNMTGADIRIVQQALIDLGYTLPRFGVDGTYAAESAATVRKFQTEQHRVNPAFMVDGVLGDQTLARLDQIFQVLDRPCGGPTVAPIDPTATSVAQAGRLTYDAGTASVLGVTLPVRGTIFYPAESAGSGTPFSAALPGVVPLVFLAHGNHSTFHDPADRTNEDCVQNSGWLAIANHDGYDFLQQALAQLGFISVSVDCNSTNCQGLSATNIRRRSGLIVESIRHLLTLAAAGSGSVLAGHVDFSKTGLFGHSRGAEAVLVVPGDLAAAGATFSPVQVKGVLSLAPTDVPTLTTMPTGFPYMVILPAADGDVVSNDGAGFYDRIAPAPFKTQLYVHRTNHNRFNRQWVNDDFAGALLSRAEHERLLNVYASAFFRQALAAVDFGDILIGKTQVAGVSNVDIHISAERSAAVTIDDHEDVPVAPATRTTTNTLGGGTTLSGTTTAVEIPFSQPGVAPDNTFFGATRGMVASSAVSSGTYRSALPVPTDFTNHEVWIRACEVFDGVAIPVDATQFQLGVEDVAGEICFAPSGLVARPFDRTAVDTFTKSMLETFRFPHTCFALARPSVDLRRIRAVVIRLNGIAARKLAFDQLQLA